MKEPKALQRKNYVQQLKKRCNRITIRKNQCARLIK